MSFRVDLQSQDAPGPRRHGPLVIAVALIAMGASAALAWTAWRVLGHHAADATMPVIHADDSPVKVPPVDPGGMTVPDQNIYVLNGTRAADSRVEQLLPPPETPLPRPTPPEPPAAASPAAPAVAAVAPPAAPAPAPVPAPTVALVAPTPAPPPATVAAPPPAAPAGGYFLQLAAVRTPEAAASEWSRLKRAQPDILGTLAQRTVRADVGDRGIYYRVEAGPLADGAAAERACGDLRQRKVGCILVRP
jgi:cell division septation protein DedD